MAFRGIIISESDIVLNGSGNDTKTLTIGYSSSDAGIFINTDASLTIGNNLNIVLAKNSFAAVDGTLIVATNRQYITNAGGTTKTIVSGAIRNNGGTIVSGENMLEFTDGGIYEHAMNDGAVPAATWSKCTFRTKSKLWKLYMGLSAANRRHLISQRPSIGNYRQPCDQ